VQASDITTDGGGQVLDVYGRCLVELETDFVTIGWGDCPTVQQHPSTSFFSQLFRHAQRVMNADA
jgi:hypothetical protein